MGTQEHACFFKLFRPKKEFFPNMVYHTRLITDTSVLDFNQLDIARDIARGRFDDIVQEPSVIPWKGESLPYSKKDFRDVRAYEKHLHGHLVFENDIITSLPYREVGHGVLEPLKLGHYPDDRGTYNLFSVHEDTIIRHQFTRRMPFTDQHKLRIYNCLWQSAPPGEHSIYPRVSRCSIMTNMEDISIHQMTKAS
jgi:hypothetical protein